MLQKSLKQSKEILAFCKRKELACKTLFFKSHKKKKEKKEKKKRTSFWKAFNWSILKVDLIHFLSRTYYLRNAIFWLLIDLILLISVGFSNIKNLFNSVFKILLMIPVTWLSVLSIINLIRNTYYSIKYKQFQSSIESLPRVNFLSGGPGCGKSSLSIVIVVLRAKIMWTKLKIKYFLISRKNRDKLNPLQQKNYDDIVNSFLYYKAHPKHIPCLWTNIPLQDFKGRKSFKLKKAHLLQKKKLPLYSVLFSDEIGNQFEAKKGSNENLKPLSRLARFIRHFFDGAWHVTEQEVSKAFIDIRRVSGSNKWLFQQKWIMKPHRLTALFKTIRSFAMYHTDMLSLYKVGTTQYESHLKKSKKQAKRWGWLIDFLIKLTSGIGWRRYEYRELGNSENNTGASNRNGFIFVPACLNAKYDDRAYREMYEAKNLPLEESNFTDLTLTDEDLAEMFPVDNEDEKKKTKNKKEK